MRGSIDIADAVNRESSLNRGLVSWWMALPDQQRGNVFRDLCMRNHGTLTNGPTWQGAMGRPGGMGSLLFDGSTSRVAAPQILIPDGGALSIIWWIRPTTFTSQRTIQSVYDSYPGNVQYTFRFESSGTPKLFVRTTGDNTVSATSAVSADTWSCVGVEINDLTKTITHYLNGAANGSGSYTGTLAVPSAGLNIGNNGLASEGFGGNLDGGMTFLRDIGAPGFAFYYQESRLNYHQTLNRVRPYTVFDMGGAAPATTSPFYFRNYIAGRAA